MQRPARPDRRAPGASSSASEGGRAGHHPPHPRGGRGAALNSVSLSGPRAQKNTTYFNFKLLHTGPVDTAISVILLLIVFCEETWQFGEASCTASSSRPWTSSAPSPHSFHSRTEAQVIMESLVKVVTSEKSLVLLHDGRAETKRSLDGVLGRDVAAPLLLVDLSAPGASRAAWLDSYNDASYVHLIAFTDHNIVLEFVNSLPNHVWVPYYLLLLSHEYSLNPTAILSQPHLRHSTFLTLLQPIERNGGNSSTAGHTHRILTYENFRPRNKVVHQGFYDSASSSLSLSSLFPDRFSSFYGHRFHLASWADDFPYMASGETLQDAYGLCILMLDNIAKRLNFTYQVHDPPADRMWGTIVNSTWRGMLGQVYRGERDFCVNSLFLTILRYQDFDYSVPYHRDSYSFVVAIPLPPPRWWSIALPFSWEMWAILILCLLVIPLPLLVLLKARDVCWWTLSRTYLEVVRALLRQDATDFSSAPSIRIFVGVWWLAAMVLSISYTGNLVAVITVPAKAQRLNTLEELSQADVIPLMIEYGHALQWYLETAAEQTIRTIREKLELIPTPDFQYVFEKVTSGSHAVVQIAEFIKYQMIQHRVSGVYLLPEVILPYYTGWIYPKNTAWKHKIDIYIQRLVESGLLDFWKEGLGSDARRKVNMTEAAAADVVESTAAKPLSLSDLQGAFIVYAAGAAAAAGVGVTEMLRCWPSPSTTAATRHM